MSKLIDMENPNWCFHLGTLSQESHELIFIKYLYLEEIKKDQSIATKFIAFVAQFYPEYRWIKFDQSDPVATVVLECFIREKDICPSDGHMDPGWELPYRDLNKALNFGAIVTDFCIRYLGYSLIGCSGQKIIITCSNNCAKQFDWLLEEGYKLQRRSKLKYVLFSDRVKQIYPNVDGYFYEYPIMPNLDTYYQVDETVISPGCKTLMKFYEPYNVLDKNK